MKIQRLIALSFSIVLGLSRFGSCEPLKQIEQPLIDSARATGSQISARKLSGEATKGPDAQFDSGFIDANGISYHYISKGDPKKPMILFIHGFPERSIAWAEQLKSLSNDYFVVAIDLKGYYLSDKPADVGQYAAAVVAQEVSAFIHKLSDRPIVVVGHDWGAAIAWTLAMMHREQLSKLIVVNGPHPLLFFREYYTNPDQTQASAYIRQIRSSVERGVELYSADNYAALRKILFDNQIGGSSNFFNDEMKTAYLESWKTPGSLAAGMKYYSAMQFPPKELFTGSTPIEVNPAFNPYHVHVPTLVLWGEKDTFLMESVNDGIGKFVDQVEVRYFPDYSHWMVHENPELVTNQIREFVSAP